MYSTNKIEPTTEIESYGNTVQVEHLAFCLINVMVTMLKKSFKHSALINVTAIMIRNPSPNKNCGVHVQKQF